MNADQARTLMEYMTKLWEGEFPATCKVLAAVPEGTRDYKPDDKSRSAWDLTVHLAAGDLWFLDSIRTGVFAWNPDADKIVVAQHPTVADIVKMYSRGLPREAEGGARDVRRRPHPDGRFLRDVPVAQRVVSGLCEQPLGAPPRPARLVSASDGLEGARDLRRQCRRTDAGRFAGCLGSASRCLGCLMCSVHT